MCNGQLLPINQNQALFALLGTTFGGNGQTNFALPNMQSRSPVHWGAGVTLGERAGQESHTVTMTEMPQHQHGFQASNTNGNTVAADNTVLAAALNEYRGPDQLVAIKPESVTNVGGSQPHNNMQPYLVLNFCIALQGIFPSQN